MAEYITIMVINNKTAGIVFSVSSYGKAAHCNFLIAQITSELEDCTSLSLSRFDELCANVPLTVIGTDFGVYNWVHDMSNRPTFLLQIPVSQIGCLWKQLKERQAPRSLSRQYPCLLNQLSRPVCQEMLTRMWLTHHDEHLMDPEYTNRLYLKQCHLRLRDKKGELMVVLPRRTLRTSRGGQIYLLLPVPCNASQGDFRRIQEVYWIV